MTAGGRARAGTRHHYGPARRKMVAALREKGITDERLLDAMGKIPRHLFGPEGLEGQAYDEVALPLGFGQTLSSPLTIARMIQALGLAGEERVLEIGTGSGYQTAILTHVAGPVFTIERIPELANAARERLRSLGIERANFRVGDGSLGWRAFAPYQGVLVSAGAPAVPRPLLDQLGDEGRLVAPVGEMEAQEIHLVSRSGDRFTTAALGEALFVPLIGRAGWKIG